MDALKRGGGLLIFCFKIQLGLVLLSCVRSSLLDVRSGSDKVPLCSIGPVGLMGLWVVWSIGA